MSVTYYYWVHRKHGPSILGTRELVLPLVGHLSRRAVPISQRTDWCQWPEHSGRTGHECRKAGLNPQHTWRTFGPSGIGTGELALDFARGRAVLVEVWTELTWAITETDSKDFELSYPIFTTSVTCWNTFKDQPCGSPGLVTAGYPKEISVRVQLMLYQNPV